MVFFKVLDYMRCFLFSVSSGFFFKNIFSLFKIAGWLLNSCLALLLLLLLQLAVKDSLVAMLLLLLLQQFFLFQPKVFFVIDNVSCCFLLLLLCQKVDQKNRDDVVFCNGKEYI